jgi:hypothetical protein
VINRNITLLGDPTLTLPWYQQALNIRLDTLASGIVVGQTTPSIDGEIRLFYLGEDKPMQTLGTKTDKFSYSMPGNVEGITSASVVNGKFTLANLPAARLKWIARTTTDTYGGGMRSSLKTNAAGKETTGPSLKASLLNESDPQACSPNPILEIQISDASPLRLVGPSGEKAIISLNDTLEIALSDVFTPKIGNNQEGTITLPFESLPPGLYKMKATCFDLYTNQGNITFEFRVSAGTKEQGSLRIYPNPMTERTSFSFLQEKRWTSYFYKLKIYSILGKQILEKNGKVAGSDSVNQTFTIDWSAEEKNQVDFINYYQLELTYDTGLPFRNFSGRIGNIK